MTETMPELNPVVLAISISPFILITATMAYVAYYFTRKKKHTNSSTTEPS